MVLGRLNGEPVATTITFYGAGVATVFGLRVVPGARGQGLGASITLAGFAEARDRGYRHGVLFATHEGVPVYRRIGFEAPASASAAGDRTRFEPVRAGKQPSAVN